MRIKMGKINPIRMVLCILAIISLYILMTELFPIIRTPYSLLSEEQTRTFNSIMNSLAIGYITGYVIYLMTVTLKYKYERHRRFWEIHDLFAKFEEIEEYYPQRIEQIPDDKILKTIKENGESITENLSSLLDRAFLYSNILSDKEVYLLCEIRRLMGNLPIKNEITTDQDDEEYVKKIKEIHYNIYELTNETERLAHRKGEIKESLICIKKRCKQKNPKSSIKNYL